MSCKILNKMLIAGLILKKKILNESEIREKALQHFLCTLSAEGRGPDNTYFLYARFNVNNCVYTHVRPLMQMTMFCLKPDFFVNQ